MNKVRQKPSRKDLGLSYHCVWIKEGIKNVNLHLAYHLIKLLFLSESELLAWAILSEYLDYIW